MEGYCENISLYWSQFLSSAEPIIKQTIDLDFEVLNSCPVQKKILRSIFLITRSSKLQILTEVLSETYTWDYIIKEYVDTIDSID